MKKVYLLFLNNGDTYKEDEEECCIGAFTTRERVDTLSKEILAWLNEQPIFSYNKREFSVSPPDSISFLAFHGHPALIKKCSYTRIQEIELHE